MPHRIFHLVAAAVFLLGFGVAASAQNAPSRYPITGAQVALSLAQAGVAISADEITLPLQLTTSSPPPALRLAEVQSLGGTRLQVRFVCSVAGGCPPFFAVINLRGGQSPSETLALLRAVCGPNLSHPSPTGTALRAGQRTTLLLEDEHMRISLPVISVDSGMVGGEVRVSSLDRKKIYQATVLDSLTVRGTLP